MSAESVQTYLCPAGGQRVDIGGPDGWRLWQHSSGSNPQDDVSTDIHTDIHTDLCTNTSMAVCMNTCMNIDTYMSIEMCA